MKLLLAAVVSAILAAAAPKPPTVVFLGDTCANAVRPIPAAFTVFDPDAVHYAGPATLEGETPASWPAEPGVIERDGGVEYTFTDKGEAEPKLCPGSERTFTEVTRWVTSAYPRCWKQITEVEGGCEDPPAEDPETIAPAPDVDPDFDEHSPEGPQPGPPGAPPVDRPDP